MASVICTSCGSIGHHVKTVTNGSIAIEIVLWLCFLIPGLIYSIWRLTTRHKACVQCGSAAIVPLNTPVGQQLVHQFYPEGFDTKSPAERRAYEMAQRMTQAKK